MLFDVSERVQRKRTLGKDFIAFEKDWEDIVAEVRKDQLRRVACEILMLFCPEDRDLGMRLLDRIEKESGANSVQTESEQPRTDRSEQ